MILFGFSALPKLVEWGCRDVCKGIGTDTLRRGGRNSMFFFRKQKKESVEEHRSVSLSDEPRQQWLDLPLHVQASSAEEQLLSIIVTAIAAGNSIKSQFEIKKVWVRNPEIIQVSTIAAALADNGNPLRITRIAEKNNANSNRV